MGFHVTSAREPEFAPEYFFNHAGKPSWCGRSVEQLSGTQFLQMLTFCREEGHNQGWNDSWNERVDDVCAGAEARCMFHTDFASGIPQQLWFESYAQGHEAATEEKGNRYPVRAGSIAELEAAFDQMHGRRVDVLYKVHGAHRSVSLSVALDGSITETYVRVGRSQVVVSLDGQLKDTFLAEALGAGLVHLRPDDAGNDADGGEYASFCLTDEEASRIRDVKET